MASKFEGFVLLFYFIFCSYCWYVIVLFNFRSKTENEDENTTSKDVTLVEKLISVSINRF